MAGFYHRQVTPPTRVTLTGVITVSCWAMAGFQLDFDPER